MTSAAIDLIMRAESSLNNENLFLPDTFESSLSTPLILASKVGNNQVAMLLIGLCKEEGNLNLADYKGNTALHYASLMRNNALIEALLLSGADPNIKNEAGLSAFEYYHFNIYPQDLEYRYGVCRRDPNLMWHECDWDKSYQATINPSFSNYRWFLPQIMINLNLANEHTLDCLSDDHRIFVWGWDYYQGYSPDEQAMDNNKLQDILRWHIKENFPVVDKRIYNLMIELFSQYRAEQFNTDIIKLFANIDEVELDETSKTDSSLGASCSF